MPASNWPQSRGLRPTVLIIALSITIIQLTIVAPLEASPHSISNDNSAIINPVSGAAKFQPAAPPNWHEPRIELRYNSRNRFVNLDERSPNSTVVAIVFVSDEDSGLSGETDIAIEAGNELGHFRLVVTPLSNTIQVNGAPLSKQFVPEYNLTLAARDRGTPQKMSLVNLLIRLTSLPIPQTTPLEPLPAFRPPLVSELIYAGTMLVILFSVSVFFIIIGCALVQKPRGKKPLPATQTGSAASWSATLDFYSL